MTISGKILADRRGNLILLLVTWVSYFTIYIGRLNFSACMGAMIVNDGYGKAALGTVAAAFYLSYGVGQLLSGVLGDRVSPRYLVAGGLAGSAVVNLLFSFSNDTAVMSVLWFINGLAQSLIWAPMARYISDRTSGAQCVRTILLLSTTGPAGMLCAYAFSAAMLRFLQWQACFTGAACLLFAVTVVWCWGSRFIDRYTENHGSPPQQEEVPGVPPGKRVSGGTGKLLLASGLLWIIFAVCLQGLLKDGLTTWIPTYFTEVFQIAPASSVLLTTLLPVMNLSGVYFANLLNRRTGNEVVSALVFFVLTAAAVAVLIFLMPGLYGSLFLFAVVTSCITAVNTIFISLVPIHFRMQGFVSTVSGLLGCVTYVGSACSSMVFGYTVETLGWSGTRLLWCLFAGLGAVFSVMASRKWARFRQDLYYKKV